jgi:hypothetical protein
MAPPVTPIPAPLTADWGHAARVPAPSVSAPPPSAPALESRDEVSGLLARAADRLELDDHSGALELAQKVLKLDPENPTAKELLERCEATLLAMLESKIGDLSRRPQLKLKPDEVVWLNLDARTGFVLSLIDGNISFDELFLVSSMSRLDTARILAKLVQERVIG